MKFIADLHIHSFYSRATSKELNFEQLYKWAQIKGIQVVATGDVTHPGWLEEIKTKLEPAEEGLFRLKDEYTKQVDSKVPTACKNEVRFILSGEISNIYKKGDQVRKIHNVVFFPSIEVAEKFQTTLEKIGNIRSDGRPILGLDAKNLLELVLESDESSFLIPAHIWTPWFSVLGSKSGFDSIEECFDDLTPQIFALETGLSSDPPMNWMLSNLDRFTLVSNSDAHSPAKLAREANLFDCALSYPAMLDAMKSSDPGKFLGTIEFFPEEGKYHLDGHRKCNMRMTPAETIANKGICPVCGKKVTVGVLYRVEELADRPKGSTHDRAKPYHSLIPLPEVIAEILKVGSGTKAVSKKFDKLLQQLGSEMSILMDAPLSDIERIGGSLLAEGIRRMRNKEVQIAAGYDGEFGTIKLFSEQERQRFNSQAFFFKDEIIQTSKEHEKIVQPSIIKDEQVPFATHKIIEDGETVSIVTDIKIDEEEDENGLNKRQREAVEHTGSNLLIVAGPGTGKTRTLTHRIAYLIQTKGVSPEQVLAVTFTNRATEEMRERLIGLLGEEQTQLITIKTFHALGALILRNEAVALDYQSFFSIYAEEDKLQLLKRIAPALSRKELRTYADRISEVKNKLLVTEFEEEFTKKETDDQFIDLFQKYQQSLQEHQAFDFDDLILQPIKLFQSNPEILKKYQERFRWISIDEYQDINLVQYHLLRLLTTPETNLCAIGDPDQAIYGFRGSDRRFFLEFEKDFPDCKVIKLEKNYRSVSTILEASGQVISKNLDHQPINIWSPIVSNTRLDIFQVPTEKSEAETIVHQIERMMGATSFFSVDSGRAGEEELESCSSFSDIAVLYRLGAQVSALEEAFIRSGIPYQTLGEVPFYETPEVKELISFLKVIHNPYSDLDLLRIINIPPRGIGDQTLKILINYQKTNELSLCQAMQKSRQIALLSETQKQPIDQLVSKIKNAQEFVKESTIADIIDDVLIQFGLSSYYKNDQRRQYYWKKLAEINSGYNGSLSDFLEQTALQKETDIYDPKAERVSLMTLHAAKGLEFPVVFIAGCEEGLIPYRHGNRSIDNIEEERRLFYVGMTRAKQRLILLHAKSRFLFGERKSNRSSRFLNDIEQALKEHRRAQIKEKKDEKDIKKHESQLNLF
jgi:DNA helicase-2/ATP-dependent DNA helicase PcrA